MSRVLKYQAIVFAPFIFFGALLFVVNSLILSYRPTVQVVAADVPNFEQFAELVDGASGFLRAVFFGLFVVSGFLINSATKNGLRYSFSMISLSIVFLMSQVVAAGFLFGLHSELIDISRLETQSGYHLISLLRWAALSIFISFCTLVCGGLELTRQKILGS